MSNGYEARFVEKDNGFVDLDAVADPLSLRFLLVTIFKDLLYT